MIDKSRLRAQLKEHEGVRKFVYDDATGAAIDETSFVRGKPTVGVGRNLADRGLDDDEIDYLLDNDINDCLVLAARFRWFEGLEPVRQAVIVELLFNLGLTRFGQFKKFITACAEHRWVHAADELKNSQWHRQVGKRAETLERQILTGEW